MKNSKNGTIFIPDISGFTDFVNSIDIDAGKNIISILLAIIMNSNHLGFKVSEMKVMRFCFTAMETRSMCQ